MKNAACMLRDWCAAYVEAYDEYGYEYEYEYEHPYVE